ncbi:ketosynthase chain-length factor [Actinomadura fibrosa]|uniref:Ketosynthase chain-length factor n=1 Tax=Actinomadura fibrosa TaxID=111802 RepID=A0ABW2Y095_9ACTN|nr:ketosynthase chain-length factor [Actinomadura fibrosa]
MTGTVVVTGLGVIAPGGDDTEAFWRTLLAGRRSIGRIDRFAPDRYRTRLAGQVHGFHAKERVGSRVAVQTDLFTQFGLAASDMALADAGLDMAAVPEYERAVVVASSSGGTEFGQREIERLWRNGPDHVGAYQSIAWFYAATTGQVSIRHGMRGPCGVICAEQAGALDAVGQARRLIRDGARAALTGGTDASLCPYGLTAQLAAGRLYQGDDPARAYRPFAADTAGFVPGEGGAILVVEDAAAAAERGARQYGTVAGYAATFDPRPDSGREPGLRRAAELALADAGRAPGDVDVVFADAAGVRELDRIEAAALTALFEPYGVPVTAPKTMTGRLYAGGAALDLVSALLAVRDGVVPPTVGIGRPAADGRLDLVLDHPRRLAVRTVLVLARGFGGFNAAVVVTAPDAAHARAPQPSEGADHASIHRR